MMMELDSQENEVEYMAYDDSSNEIQELPTAPPKAPSSAFASAGVPLHMMETQPIGEHSPPLAPAAAAPSTQQQQRGRSPAGSRNVIRAPSSDDGDSDDIDVVGEERPGKPSSSTPAAPHVKSVVFKNNWFNGAAQAKNEEPSTASPEQCEVKLIVGPGPKRAIIPVQKGLLANIPYFRTKLKEQGGPEYEITFPQLTKEAVNRILDYHTTGEMMIPESIPKIHDLMKAAVEIRMDQLLNKCIELLKKMLSLDNCLELRQIAAESSYTFANDIDDFIRNNFHRLYTRPEFLDLGCEGFEELVQIYTKHGDFRHALIYKAIVAWVRHEDRRSQYLPQLMKLVNLAVVLSENEGLKREDFDILEERCPRLCLEAYKDNYWSRSSASTSKAVTKRGARGRGRQESDSEDSVVDPKRVKKEPTAAKPTERPSRARAEQPTRSARKSAPPPPEPTRTTRRSSVSRSGPAPKQEKPAPPPPRQTATATRRGNNARGDTRTPVVNVPRMSTPPQRGRNANATAAAEAEPEIDDEPSGGLRLLYSLKQKSQSHLYTYDFVTHACRPAYRIREHRFLSSVIVHEGKIYDIGGTLDPSKRKDSPNMEIFEKGKLNGKAGPRLKHKRKEFAACVFKDAIYAIGGGEGNAAMNCVEMLPLNGDSGSGPGRAAKWAWKEVEFLSFPRGALAGAVLGDRIFSVGGIGGESETFATVQAYDAEKNVWTNAKSMNTARGYHQVAVLDDKLYAVGGEGSNGQANNVVEYYDAGADKWTTVASMHHARREFGLVTWEGQLYAIGGNEDKVNPTMERYDPRANTWELMDWPDKLQKNASFQACAIAP